MYNTTGVPSDGLEDNVHIDSLLSQQGENLKGDAGLVGKSDQGDPGHILILGNTAHMCFFHCLHNLLHFCTRFSAEAGQYLQIDAVPLGHLD